MVNFHRSIRGNTLYLCNKSLSDEDIVKFIIPFLEDNPYITSLNIQYNHIGDEGAKALIHMASK